MVALPLLPVAWLIFNHEEAGLLILHSVLLVTVISDVSLSGGKETSVAETDSSAVIPPFFLQDINDMTAIRNPTTIPEHLILFI
jgi:hypothetical protein